MGKILRRGFFSAALSADFSGALLSVMRFSFLLSGGFSHKFSNRPGRNQRCAPLYDRFLLHSAPDPATAGRSPAGLACSEVSVQQSCGHRTASSGGGGEDLIWGKGGREGENIKLQCFHQRRAPAPA